MSQELYVVDLITKYGSFLDASVTRTFDTPMEEGLVLSAADQPEVGSEAHAAMAASHDVYMSLVGGFLWLANMTHFGAALRLLAYTSNAVGPGRSCVRPQQCARPGHVRRLELGHSVLGERLLDLLPRVLVPLWFSKMQKSVSLSSAEAEYFGAMMAARDLIFARDLLVELAIPLATRGPQCDVVRLQVRC